MQQRRLRPGDVLDDYCPRERRITDHAIVAMIDDEIQQTRCVVCDAEHEYKQAKVPAQRRKKAPALFTQVLDGLKAPAPPRHAPDLEPDEPESVPTEAFAEIGLPPLPPEPRAAAAPSNGNGDVHPEVVLAPPLHEDVEEDVDEDRQPVQDGPLFRRQLIRAALPRPEGTTPPARVIPEFTIRQPGGRPNRHGGRRRGQSQGQGQNGSTRFGRGGHGQRSKGQGRQGGHGFGNQGGPSGNRGGNRRGGKKR
jgi:hypothetical protein